MSNVLVLIDDDLQHDHRVQNSINSAGDTVQVLDIREYQHIRLSFFNYLYSGVLILLALSNVIKIRRIYTVLGSSIFKENLFSGLKAYIRWLLMAMRSALFIKKNYDQTKIKEIHAHDLYCAFVVTLLPKDTQRGFVYDCHEFQIHRNRKTGLLRIVSEYFLEKRVLNQCTQLRLVNHAVIPATQYLYGDLSIPIKVIYNNPYVYHPIIKNNSQQLAMIYVGKGIYGRQLQLLNYESCSKLQMTCFMYFLGQFPDNMDQYRHWTLGHVEYLPELVDNLRTHRCLMWCCLDNVSFSYRMATPNKFFQAIALGMPIVASKDSYLAEIVAQYGLGYVLNGDDLLELALVGLSSRFDEWVSNVETFRNLLKQNVIQI